MKKALMVALLVLFATPSVFAAEEAAVLAAPAAATVNAAPQSHLTLAAALDKVGREYREMWIKDRSGKRLKRACDFQCTQWCDEHRRECYTASHGATYCEGQWEICMCDNQCCWGPGGNPYCG
jgi:hypothetical protein